MPKNSVADNKIRMAKVWLDEYAPHVLSTYKQVKNNKTKKMIQKNKKK